MNQACPIEPGGSFLGIAVGEYQHHRSLPCVVPRMREFAVLLEGFGYRPTVLENPTAEQLRTGLREWRQRPVPAPSPVVLAWSGRATAVGDVLRLAAHDTSAAFEPDCSYRPESLVENALGSGADQILLLIDTCRADRDAVHAVRVALGDWAKRACPPGGAGWLGVLANCPADDPADDQDAVGSGILLEAAGRLLRAGSVVGHLPPGMGRAERRHHRPGAPPDTARRARRRRAVPRARRVGDRPGDVPQPAVAARAAAAPGGAPRGGVPRRRTSG